MIPGILGAAATLAVLFLVPGRLAVRSWLAAPIAGLCLVGPALVCASALFGFTALTVAATWIVLVALLAVRRTRGPGTGDGDVSGRALAAAAFIAAIPAAQLVPVHMDGGLFLDSAYFDQAKVCLVDALARHGLPPRSPHFLGEPLPYYFVAHFLAATPRVLLGLGSWSCLIAFTWFAGVALIGVVASLARGVAGPRAGRYALLLAALGPPTLALRKIGFLRQLVTTPKLHGIGTLIQQIETVPQHVVAAGALLFAIRTAVRDAEARPWRAALFAGSAFAFAAGSSVWLALVFAACAPAILVRRPQLWRLGLISGVVAFVLGLPVLHALVSGEGGPAPVAVEVLRTSLLTGQTWAQIALYWFQFTPLWMGLVFLAGLRGLRRAEPSLFRDIAVPCCLVPLCITLFFKSTIVNNDLGWRAVLLPCSLLVVWAAVALERRQVSRVMAVGGIVIGLWAAARCWTRPDPDHAGELHRRFARQPEAWAAVRRHAGPDDVVQNNPAAFRWLTLWPCNISWSLFADRNAAAADPINLFAYAWRSGERPRAALRAVEAVFQRRNPGREDVRRLAETWRIRVLLVGVDDAVWPGDVLADSGYYKLVQDAKDYRVFVRE